jgi:hypothetical protein
MHLLSGFVAARRLRVQGLEGRTTHHGHVIARELVVAQQLTDLHLDEVEQLVVIDLIALVEEDDDGRNADLATEEDVLLGLRHRAVVGRHNQDRAVHLGRAGDHVLDVVGVAGAVDVRIVAVVGLVLDVRGRDRDDAGVVADRAALGDVGVGLLLAQTDRGERARQRRRRGGLTMSHVTDRADVHVGLRPLKDFLGHLGLLVARGAGKAARWPRTWTRKLRCSTALHCVPSSPRSVQRIGLVDVCFRRPARGPLSWSC